MEKQFYGRYNCPVHVELDISKLEEFIHETVIESLNMYLHKYDAEAEIDDANCELLSYMDIAGMMESSYNGTEWTATWDDPGDLYLDLNVDYIPEKKIAKTFQSLLPEFLKDLIIVSKVDVDEGQIEYDRTQSWEEF